MRLSTHLFKSGSSLHITIPKPALAFLNWKHGQELIVLIDDDKTLRILSLESHIEQTVKERVDAATSDRSGAPR